MLGAQSQEVAKGFRICTARTIISVNSWISLDLPTSRSSSERLSDIFKTDLIDYFVAFGNQELGDVTEAL